MSIDDILDSALGAIEPCPAPVGATIREGRAIRVRRHVIAAAGLAAVVAAVTVPVALRGAAAPAPVTPGGYSVTVQPPGPRSPANLIASGTVDGRAWQVTGSLDGGGTVTWPGLNFTGRGVAFSPEATAKIVNVFFMPGGAGQTDPISFWSGQGGPVQVQAGLVGDGVTYATVRFGNGTVLILRPATVHGIRAVAFAAPLGVTIVRVTAYSRHGELGTEIPLIRPGQEAYLGSWLRPGQQTPASAGGVIASGKAGGHTWSASAYAGPWGTCLAIGAGLNCQRLGIPVFTTFWTWQHGPPGTAVGTAQPAVTRVDIALPGGAAARSRPVVIGGAKYFAFGDLPRMANLRWTAYNAAGKLIARGVF